MKKSVTVASVLLGSMMSISASAQSINDCRMKVRHQNSQIADLRVMLQDEKSHTQDLQSKIQGLKVEIKSCQQSAGGAQVERLKAKNKRLQNQVENLKTANQSLTHQNNGLSQDLQSCEESGSRAKVKQLKEKVENLQEKIAMLKAKLKEQGGSKVAKAKKVCDETFDFQFEAKECKELVAELEIGPNVVNACKDLATPIFDNMMSFIAIDCIEIAGNKGLNSVEVKSCSGIRSDYSKIKCLEEL